MNTKQKLIVTAFIISFVVFSIWLPIPALAIFGYLLIRSLA